MTGASEKPGSPVARTVKEFCRAYGIGKTMAYELFADGKIETRKIGSRTLVIEESARQWLRSLPILLPIPETQSLTNGSEPRRIRQYHKSRKSKGKVDNTRKAANAGGS